MLGPVLWFSSLLLISKKKVFSWGVGGMDPSHSRQSGESQSHCGCCVICLYREKYIISVFRYDTHMLNPESLLLQAKPSPAAVPGELAKPSPAGKVPL